MPFCEYFDIDLPRALREQLVEALGKIETGALTAENLNKVPLKRGVYQLHHQGELVYVGKANRLRTRLNQHLRKIQGRENIGLAEMSFKCLWMSPNWITLAPESQLITFYKAQEKAIWNRNGFGPNDPGAGREDRNKPPALFDKSYPIRENWPCEFATPGRWKTLDLLVSMKASLPYLLRFQRASADFEGTSIELAETNLPASELLRRIAAALPAGWQATKFPSHMILYKQLRQFQYGTILFPAQPS